MEKGYYILDENGEPKNIPDLMEWGKWMQANKRHVADEKIRGSRVSTVFLALDHNWGDGDPVLWETMVFDGDLDGEMDRCSGGRKDAEEMHKKMVEKVLNHSK